MFPEPAAVLLGKRKLVVVAQLYLQLGNLLSLFVQSLLKTVRLGS